MSIMSDEPGPPTPTLAPSAGASRTTADDSLYAAFLGRITAGATHEFRNVLAIIKESAGLVDDLLADAGTGALTREKVEWATGRIAAQVERGAALCTSLNHVAHGLDRPSQVIALETAVADAVLLWGRAARQRQRRLAALPGEGSPTVERNALQLYMGLVAVLEWCVERVPEGGTLALRAEIRDQSPCVTFRSEPVWQEELAEGGGPAAGVDGRVLAALSAGLEIPSPGSELVLLFR